MLASLSQEEDLLLKAWYREKVRPEEPVLHVLWSQELIQKISGYTVEALKAAAHVTRSTQHEAAVSPLRVLCVGSGASRLCHYLQHILNKVFAGEDVRVAAIVPALRGTSTSLEPMPARWPQLGALPQPVEASYTLDEALKAYRPTLVICACMPPETDWSRSFRRAPSVVEYLLVGPADSDRSGDCHLTWGGPDAFKSRGRPPPVPRYAEDGFVRHELDEISNCVLGTEDAPGRVGLNSVVAFRRLIKPKIVFEGRKSDGPNLIGASASALPSSSMGPESTRWHRQVEGQQGNRQIQMRAGDEEEEEEEEEAEEEEEVEMTETLQDTEGSDDSVFRNARRKLRS
eukprot:TRINITY_DN950_c1_g1_i4.p1 TRINITY_DN950_c1_g1~~TRINITY_DN950_c1_g1_i4.p1  ORF type:complete len:344 (+),score=71.91 TRINITY_DN950_c1_g1_i4:255-1286(+)